MKGENVVIGIGEKGGGKGAFAIGMEKMIEIGCV